MMSFLCVDIFSGAKKEHKKSRKEICWNLEEEFGTVLSKIIRTLKRNVIGHKETWDSNQIMNSC